MENDRNSYFSILPDQCLEIILDYLPVFDLLKAEQVCLKWRNLCGYVWRLKRKLVFDYNWNRDDMEAVLCRCGGFITYLDIDLFDFARYPPTQTLISIKLYCRRLEYLRINHLHLREEAEWYFLTDCFPTLTSFHLGDCSKVTEGHIETLLVKAANLENLTLNSGINFSNGGAILLKISDRCKYLDMKNCRISSSLISDILRRLTNLETLIVGRIYVEDEVLPLLYTTNPNLKHLDLTTSMSQFHINALSLLPNLETLKLNCKGSVTSEEVICLAEKLQNQLEEFHCKYCPYVINTALERMVELCSKLRLLNVEDCKLVSSRFLIEALFIFKLKKNKVPLEIITNMEYESFDKDHKSILENESHPLLRIKYA